jgi:hypothetical protein
MHNLRRKLIAAATVFAMLIPGPALASHEEGAQPAQQPQPAQPVPSQGGAPEPTQAAPEEDDEGASALLTAGIVAGLLVIGGGLAFAKGRGRGPSPAAD